MNRKFSFLFFIALLFISCEDVVEVDLPTAEPRLVVEAFINWQEGTDGAYQVVRLSTTAGYYETQVPPVEGATVYITDSSNSYSFVHNGAGYYVCDAFLPVTGETYTLFIEHEGETYTATESLLPTPNLLYAEHTTEGIRAYFNDPAAENYYMSDFFKYNYGHDTAVFDDRFVNGNLTYTVRFARDLEPGDTFGISLYGISKRHYNYMMKLYNIAGGASANPFQVPPGIVRGNIVNLTNPDNFAFGYFNLSEGKSLEYIVP